jgi:dehydrogenase/reductase SDR family protein 12
VTGANSGIGLETARAILQRGGTVHLVCRNAARGEEARGELVRETGNQHAQLHVVDMSSPAQVKAFARAFVRSGLPLHCLVNNAGGMANERVLTRDGLELNFATNTLGTFVLTEELLPALQRAAPGARVVTVSSGGMLTQPLDTEDLNMERMRPFDGAAAYAQNKRAQVCLTEYWARQHEAKGVRFQAMHPGWADTPALRESMPDFRAKLLDRLRTPAEGADTVVWLAVSREAEPLPAGEFFLDRKPQSKHLPLAFTSYSDADVERLVARLREIARPLEPSPEHAAAYAYLAK